MYRPSVRACPDSFGKLSVLVSSRFGWVGERSFLEGGTETWTAATPEASRLTGSWQMPQEAGDSAVLRLSLVSAGLSNYCSLSIPGENGTDALYCTKYSKDEVRTNILIPALLKPVAA
jgi:hypothetical protein